MTLSGLELSQSINLSVVVLQPSLDCAIPYAMYSMYARTDVWVACKTTCILLAIIVGNANFTQQMAKIIFPEGYIQYGIEMDR